MTASPESLALLGRAAELRAAGTSWADAANQLAVARDELRRLVAENHRDYERLARRARAEVLRETLDAALSALRDLMRSGEPTVRMVAATTFVRYELSRLRYGPAEARERLALDTSARGRRRLTAEAENVRNEIASESTEVPKPQDVAAPKKEAHTAPASAPAGAKPAAPTPAAAPSPNVKAQATPADATGQNPPDELTRRRVRLLDDLALGRGAPAPFARDNRLDLEIQRLADRPRADGK